LKLLAARPTARGPKKFLDMRIPSGYNYCVKEQIMNVDKTHEWTNQQILRLYDIIEDLKAENAKLKAERDKLKEDLLRAWTDFGVLGL